ncbi:hypothetical protein S4A8_14884 [Salinisphaera sp. S4-8]
MGAVAVNKISQGLPAKEWAPWFVVAGLLILLCWLLLKYVAKNAQMHTFQVTEFEQNDQGMLAFLVAYLLPFISSETMSFDGHWLTGTYIISIIFLVVIHTGAMHFNPVMGLLGYHFYRVKNRDGASRVLISRNELYRVGCDIKTVQLAHRIYLDVGGTNAR